MISHWFYFAKKLYKSPNALPPTIAINIIQIIIFCVFLFILSSKYTINYITIVMNNKEKNVYLNI